MSGKAYECKVCGSKKLERGAFCAVHYREYRTNNMRESRSAKKAMAARGIANRPNMTIQPQRGRPQATACKECDAPAERGAYCLPHWREHASYLRYGADHEYAPAAHLEIGDDCPQCGRPVRQKHPNYALCLSCGAKKAIDYQRERRANAKRAIRSKAPRSPRQYIAPPAPKIEVKPEPVVIPEGFQPRPRVELHISRWEHGGETIWTPKP